MNNMKNVVVLDYYGGPFIFTFEDQSGVNYLAYYGEDSFENNIFKGTKYLVIKSNRTKDLMEGAIDIREFITTALELSLTEFSAGWNVLKTQKVSWIEVDDYIPESNIFLRG